MDKALRVCTAVYVVAVVSILTLGGVGSLSLAITGSVVVVVAAAVLLVTVTKVRAHQVDASRRRADPIGSMLLSMPMRSSITDDHESLPSRDSLTNAARQQHDAMQQRWLNGLSSSGCGHQFVADPAMSLHVGPTSDRLSRATP